MNLVKLKQVGVSYKPGVEEIRRHVSCSEDRSLYYTYSYCLFLANIYKLVQILRGMVENMLIQKSCLFLPSLPTSILSPNPKYEDKKAFQQKGFQFWSKDRTNCFLLPTILGIDQLFC